MDIVLIQQNQHNQDWRQAPRVCLEDYTDTECIKKFRLNKDTIQVITNQLKDVLQSATNRNNQRTTTHKKQINISRRLTKTKNLYLGLSLKK